MQCQSSSERLPILLQCKGKVNNTRQFGIGGEPGGREQTGIKQWLYLDLFRDETLLPEAFTVDPKHLMLIDVSCHHHGNRKGFKNAAEVARSIEIDETAGVEDYSLLRENNASYHIALLIFR